MLKAFKLYVRRLLPFFILFVVAQTCIRVLLAIVSFQGLTSPLDFILPFLTGLWFDIAVAFIAAPVFLIFPLILPNSYLSGRLDRFVAFFGFVLLTISMLFQACAEYFFWDEFTTRFNFIAVDYLIYTQEVLGNIFESYPVFPLLAAISVFGIFIAFLSRKFLFAGLAVQTSGIFHRLGAFALFIGLGFGAYTITSKSIVDTMDNEISKEIGSNGGYNFVYAFFNNEIEFKKFYPTLNDAKVQSMVKAHYAKDGKPVVTAGASLIERDIIKKDPMLRKNIMHITIESMNVTFMSTFGNTEGLTPNLDKLAQEGLFLANMRATGTRTVRGLEALTLSVPPTPGQSILRRPDNGNLYTIGAVLQDRGYETKFLYGGYGYFDNMNGFFQSNGYTTGDRADMASEDIHFANNWGVGDEDLFDFAIKNADMSYAAGKNFLNMVMTTSNHRPFTYPDGKIDIPSPGGRNGAVKYTDYAIGQLIKKASTKPWFKDTIFVFVSDHTESVAGKVELDFNRYHIPCIIWSPDFIKPTRIDRLTSQIDVAPTVLGLLNTSYRSRFYGTDVLSNKIPSQIFVSNYEKVALVRDDAITILEPISQVRQFNNDQRLNEAQFDQPFIDQTISIYQQASDWRTNMKRIDTIIPVNPQ
jgi:phosphoglycerol transferase MdoB-like AlkP superfamily enzyme